MSDRPIATVSVPNGRPKRRVPLRRINVRDQRANNIPVTTVLEWLGSWVSSVSGVGTVIARASLLAGGGVRSRATPRDC